MRVLKRLSLVLMLLSPQLAIAQDKEGVLTDEQLQAAMDFGNSR